MSETSANPAPRWRVWGPPLTTPKPLWALLTVSIIVAAETFIEGTGDYPLYMSVLILAVALWLAWSAWKARALVGLLAIPLAAPWFYQTIGGEWLSTQGVIFYLAHSLFAVFVAVAAYSFMAREGGS